MKEVSQIIRRKGQRLVNELEIKIMFARHHSPAEATVEAQVEALQYAIKKVREVFELPVISGDITKGSVDNGNQ